MIMRREMMMMLLMMFNWIVASWRYLSLIDAYFTGGLAVSATFLINILLFFIFFGQVLQRDAICLVHTVN